jgi:phosphoglycolate phosphatase-like HAD superfamily hydrolase
MGKTLFVSDFDDTLAQTDSKIFLTRGGKRIEMDPAAFAVYDEQPGDKFDFSEFDKLINPKPIQRFVKLLQQAIGRADKIAVLTARGHTRPVAQFLKMHGITSGVSIAALGDANPEKKAAYIRKHMKDGYDKVAFIDDSPKNVQAVKALRTEFPDAKILVHQAKEEEDHVAKDEPATKEKSASEPETSVIAQQAKQLGLTDMKFGRYGKEGKVTHIIQNGQLVLKPKEA